MVLQARRLSALCFRLHDHKMATFNVTWLDNRCLPILRISNSDLIGLIGLLLSSLQIQAVGVSFFPETVLLFSSVLLRTTEDAALLLELSCCGENGSVG